MPRLPLSHRSRGHGQGHHDGTQDLQGLGAGDSYYVSRLVDEAEEGALLNLLSRIDYVPRDRLTFSIFGRWTILPRDKQFFGTPNADGTVPHYRYGGSYVPRVLPFPPELAQLLERLKESQGQLCNHPVVNRYVGGGDHIGPHRDKVRDFVPGSSVMTLSLGCPRRLLLRNDDTGEAQSVELLSGSLFVLGPRTNAEWKHAIPKVSGLEGTRISVTLRAIQTRYDPQTGAVVDPEEQE